MNWEMERVRERREQRQNERALESESNERKREHESNERTGEHESERAMRMRESKQWESESGEGERDFSFLNLDPLHVSLKN